MDMRQGLSEFIKQNCVVQGDFAVEDGWTAPYRIDIRRLVSSGIGRKYLLGTFRDLAIQAQGGIFNHVTSVDIEEYYLAVMYAAMLDSTATALVSTKPSVRVAGITPGTNMEIVLVSGVNYTSNDIHAGLQALTTAGFFVSGIVPVVDCAPNCIIDQYCKSRPGIIYTPLLTAADLGLAPILMPSITKAHELVMPTASPADPVQAARDEPAAIINDEE